MPVSDSCWSLAGVLIDEIACTFPTLKGLFERPVRSDQVGDRYSINVSSGVSDQGVRTFSTPPAPVDTLLPLTTGSSLAVQFSSYGDLPAVIHIGRKVPKGDTDH